jgi:fumarate reductase subunit D
MRDMNVWHLLAVHVPNLLPRTIFGLHLPWLRKAARLLYAIVLFAIGLAAAYGVIKTPKKSTEPSTWVQVILGAMFVWIMFALGYGVIPHEWLTFANSYLNFDSSSFLMHKNRILHFDITRDKVADAVAAVIYVVVLGLNIFFFAAWQKRKVAEPATGDGAASADTGPITGGTIFSRLRRTKRTSAYGRPVTTTTES